MAEPTRYDLVERPWILVRRGDGQVAEVSLLELFAHAHELRGVLGEIPTQSFAIVRVLLAIMHRAVEGPRDAGEWSALWRSPTLPVDDIAGYLDHFRDRFDLLSPKTPFYQVADLRTGKGEVTGLDRLIADVPTGERFFTTRLGAGIERLSFAEAARWVVHCQAYDPSGIKSGAVGDPRVKGGRGYPIGTGWAGALGGVLAEGATLRETLLLNLIPEDRLPEPPSEDDLPAWERDPQGPAPEFPDDYRPAGPLQLYTWQSRRIRLFHDADGVYGVLVANGDPMKPQNRHRIEPLSVWRRSQAQEKKTGDVPTYMPLEHRPERAIWRGLETLLLDTWHQASGKDAAAYLRPALLNWLDTARGTGVLDAGYHVRTRAVGMRYGSKSTTTTEIIDDAVDMAVVLLGDRELRATAIDAVADAEAYAQALGDLASNLAEAAGGDGAGPRDRARELAYQQLDRPFRVWLASLGPDTEPTRARQAWQRTADDIIRRLGRELVDQAGPVAWRGRDVRGRHVSTPEADLWFRGKLRTILTAANLTEATEVPA